MLGFASRYPTYAIGDRSGYDFLSNLPTSIQESLEEAGIAPSLTASLSAEPILSAIEIPNTTIGHNRFIEDSTVSIDAPPINISQIGLDKNGISQGNLLDSGSPQSSFGEINSVESTLHDDNIIHIGSIKDSSKSNGFREGSSAQISINENSIVNGTSKYSINQISSSEVDSFEFSPTEIGISTISPTQVSSFEINTTEISLGEISPAQISSSEIDSTFKTSVGEVSSTQISIPQITSRNLNSSEISLTSSIPSEQFFSIHDSTPEIINALNNSPTNNDSFDGQNVEPKAIYAINSTNAPLVDIPDSRWVSSLNPTYAIANLGDRTLKMAVLFT